MGNLKKKKKKKVRLGDCYEVAGLFMMDNEHAAGFEKPILVHGIVEGQGDLKGTRFGHAWIEIGEGIIVIDKSNGNDITMLAKDYYRVGKIEKTAKYTYKQAMDNMLKHKHFGAWDGIKRKNKEPIIYKKGDK